VRVVSQRAESKERAVARGGESRGAGLREGTGKIICLKVLLKRGKRGAIANFDREFIPY